MNLLALDTCLAACSVAVVREGVTLSRLSEPMARGHQERLALMAREAMSQARVAFVDLDRIGVTVGPGSFTGLRVGLAFAKGLAVALGKPCVGVGTLEALAASDDTGPVAAVIDAGRGRVYLQLFDAGRALTGPDILDIGVAQARLIEVFPSGDATLIGPGAYLLSGASSTYRLIDAASPDPVAVAHLAMAAAPIPPRPLYLRPPDATAKAA